MRYKGTSGGLMPLIVLVVIAVVVIGVAYFVFFAPR